LRSLAPERAAEIGEQPIKMKLEDEVLLTLNKEAKENL
jgi:hypothetical protein